MKAYDILEQAARLATGAPPDPLISKAGVGLVNTVLSDLGHEAIELLSDEVCFSHLGGTTVTISGVAMLICILLGDDVGVSAMNELYQSSRSRLLKHTSKIKNTAFGGIYDED